MAYRLLGMDLEALKKEYQLPAPLREYLESGHRDWDNGWHSDGWAQSQNDKLLEKYVKAKAVKVGKNQSNLDLLLASVELIKDVKKNKLGMYVDGGTYDDWGSGYWAVYTEY